MPKRYSIAVTANIGWQPGQREWIQTYVVDKHATQDASIALINAAIGGDLVLSCSPATLTTTTKTTATSRLVTISLKDSSANVHTWADLASCTASLTTSQTATTVTNVTLSTTNITFSNGVATVTVSVATNADGRGIVAADYEQLNVNAVILNYSLTAATSKNTFA